MPEMSQVSKIVFAIVFLGQAMSSHHSDQMSERPQVPRIAPLGCSLMEVSSTIVRHFCHTKLYKSGDFSVVR